MSKSWTNSNGARAVWYRRIHRWLGLVVLVFVLLLSVTGIALNHVDGWRLDERYVRWPWLLGVYGIEAPEVAASFAGDGHRATLLGGRLYLDHAEVARHVVALAGVVVTEDFVVIAADDDLLVLTPRGELVERVELQWAPARTLDAIGIAAGRVVVRSGAHVFRFDADMLNMESWRPASGSDIRWSVESPAPAEVLDTLRDRFLGRGLSFARILTDLHSGRIVARVGVLLTDAIAVLLIVLSGTGLLLWLSRGGNGGRKPRPPR